MWMSRCSRSSRRGLRASPRSQSGNAEHRHSDPDIGAITSASADVEHRRVALHRRCHARARAAGASLGMSFLLDNNLSPSWPNFSEPPATTSCTRDVGLGSATDSVVIEAARVQGRVLVSADTDFGTLLARTHATTPSFLLMRRASGRRASEQATIILSNPNVVQADLGRGRHRGPRRGDATHPPTSHRCT